jgi:hypothetical protein
MKFSLGVQSPALAYDSVAHMIQTKVLVDSAKLLAEIHCALLMDKTFDNVDKQKLKITFQSYVSAIYRSACTAPRIFETQDEGQRQCMGLQYRKREQGRQCELRRLRR